MGLVLMNWGGTLHTDAVASSPVEIWSNTLAVETSQPVTLAMQDALGLSIINYWADVKPRSDSRVSFDFIKVNEYNVEAPFHQITDPSYEALTPGNRGSGGTVGKPITEAIRVTLDDNTRHRRSRGGWYIPCPSSPITNTWRYSDSECNAWLAIVNDFLHEVDAVPGCTPAVWSRADQSTTTVKRIRIGNVPDNISRRKSELRESYKLAML